MKRLLACTLMMVLQLGSAAALAADSLARVNLPIRFHLLTDLSMRKGNANMTSWVVREDIEKTVLPEVNRIWRPANIVFELEAVMDIKALHPADSDQLIRYIVNSSRDYLGKSDPQRIKALRKLIDWSTFKQGIINVYLVPYLGQASQGNTKRKLKCIFLGQWSDKASKGRLPPEKFRLVEPEPYKKGSVSRTLAHELGHMLGLKHPDKDSQTEFGLLMGGRRAGYALTREDIKAVRAHANF